MGGREGRVAFYFGLYREFLSMIHSLDELRQIFAYVHLIWCTY